MYSFLVDRVTAGDFDGSLVISILKVTVPHVSARPMALTCLLGHGKVQHSPSGDLAEVREDSD